MNSSTFKIGQLIIYFVLVSIFLLVSGNVGQYLINVHGISREIGLLLQGVIFTGLTLIVLYLLKRKNPELFKKIGLKGVNSPTKLIIGITIPIFLLLFGISTAYMMGGIENVSLNISTSVIIAILINAVTAFLYEAFPEEVFLRGLIFEELHKKFSFITSLFLQPVIFICVPTVVIALEAIILDYPFALTFDYFILLYIFGIVLQLYRTYTGTLWMSIFFHVVYLEVSRFISMGSIYNPDTALLTFDEAFGGFMRLYLSFLILLILSAVVLSILILVDKRKSKIQN